MTTRGRLSLLLAAGLCGLAACRQAPPGDPDRRIVVWEHDDASVASYIDSVLAAFCKLPGNEGVSIVRTHYHTEDMRQQFQTASIAGNLPDLLLSASDAAGIYAISGFIQPVDGLFDLSRYNPAVVAAITQDGRTWGVPVTNGNHLMLFYNKRLSPRPPRTTDELFAFCAGRAPKLGLGHCLAFHLGEPYWLVPWLGAFGGWPMAGRAPTLDTPAMRQAVEFMLELKRRGFIAQSSAPMVAGQEVFSSLDATQPCGLVAQAAVDGVSHVAVLELQLSATENSSLHVGTADGPALSLLPLPYLLRDDI